MRELITIQKREKINRVYAVDERGNGNANHIYRIKSEPIEINPAQVVETTIKFQNGGRNEWGSVIGVIDTDLLEIVRDRLKGFQSGNFSSRENACALTHVDVVKLSC